MNYALDFSCIDKTSSGAKQRILSIYKNIILENKKINFTIIYTNALELKKIFNSSNVFFKRNPFNQSNYFNKILSIIFVYLYLTLNKKKYHVVEYFTLPFLKIKDSVNVITIHDLRKLYFSKSIFINFFIRFIYSIFLNSAEKILVVSNSAKKELESYFNVSHKIIVSYNVLSDFYLQHIKKTNLLKIKKKYNLPKEFIISVGHLEKRKNFLSLIRAIKILKDNKIYINLIIIGQTFNHYNLINNEIEKLKLRSNVRIFSNLDDYELLCFYRLADLFVYPSLYEGFGIPMLESMSSNLPIVLSNLEIFREITKNKYQYFDPYDPFSIANKIRFVLNDNLIKKKMISYGTRRVKIFDSKYQSKKLISNILR